jgi:hypothetical protein
MSTTEIVVKPCVRSFERTELLRVKKRHVEPGHCLRAEAKGRPTIWNPCSQLSAEQMLNEEDVKRGRRYMQAYCRNHIEF